MKVRSASVQRLPEPPDTYDKEYMERLISSLSFFMTAVSADTKVVVFSPNGKKWTVTVDNSGNLGTE